MKNFDRFPPVEKPAWHEREIAGWFTTGDLVAVVAAMMFAVWMMYR